MHAAPALEPPRRAPMLPTIADRRHLATWSTPRPIPFSRHRMRSLCCGPHVSTWMGYGSPTQTRASPGSSSSAALEAAATHLDDVSYETPVDQLKRHRTTALRPAQGYSARAIAGVAEEVAQHLLPGTQAQVLRQALRPGATTTVGP